MLRYDQMIEQGSWFDRLFGEVKSIFSYFKPEHVKNYVSAWDDTISGIPKGIERAVKDSSSTVKGEVKDLGRMVEDTGERLKLPWRSKDYVRRYQEENLPHIYATANENYNPGNDSERQAA